MRRIILLTLWLGAIHALACGQDYSVLSTGAATHGHNIRFAAKTNMLYDALLVPNIGVEASFGSQWSASATWMYAWWSKDSRQKYWRIYGGSIEGRYWLGKRDISTTLTGHHVGVYAQMLTYDFELGIKGQMAPRWCYGAGISYGYSLPVARRLNIDFTIGLGYFGGKYLKYCYDGGNYVWQSTHHRNYFGPTHAGVSLVWRLGHDNVNNPKGGER